MSEKVGRRDLLESIALAAAVGGSSAVFAGGTATAAMPDTGSTADAATRREILTLARALEAAEEQKNPESWAALVAEDYTEINGRFATVLRGRELGQRLQEFAKALPHVIAGSYMSNPDLQIFGELAILCYVSLRSVRDREGRSDPACRRVTRVFTRNTKGWLLLHTHFSSFDYVSTY